MTQFIQLQKLKGNDFIVQVSSIDTVEPAALKDEQPKCFIRVKGVKIELENDYLDVLNRISSYAMVCVVPMRSGTWKEIK